MEEKQKNLKQFLESLSNEDLLQIFNFSRDILNLQTISSFKRKHGLSYNGVRFKKNLRTKIQKIELIVDNEKQKS